MTTDDRFIEAAANTARQRDEWKARAEKAERAVAESQARERELRAALAKLSTWAVPGATEHSGGEWRETVALVRAALSAPQDDSSLREFGLKVAKYAHELDGPVLSAETIVDAVLKGAE